MIAVIEAAVVKSRSANSVDPLFIDTVVDFISTYADRTHHGKEEDIMFRELDQRDLSKEDRRIMDELIDEHVFGRRITKELVEANTLYRNGDDRALAVVISKLQAFVDFYPRHIAKEDKVFFPAARAYVTDEEDLAMLEEFWEFDRKMIHEKYRLVVKNMEKEIGLGGPPPDEKPPTGKQP
jgi:hemerythrin-like domain-containing protein